MKDTAKTSRIFLQVAIIVFAWVIIIITQLISTFAINDEQVFCFRALECVRQFDLDIPFKPYYTWNRESYGDLGNMTGLKRFQVPQIQKFTTDEYGFRNPPGTLNKCCDIVVIGDSFGIGVKTSDEDTFPGQLRKMTGLSIYNYSSEPLAKFMADTRFQEHRPKWVILFYVERNLELESFAYRKITEPYTPHRFNSAAEFHEERRKVLNVEKSIKANLDNIRFLSKITGRLFKEPLYNLGLWGLPKTIYYVDPISKMLFYNEKVEKKFNTRATQKNIDLVISALLHYQKDLADRNIRLLTVIIPDKETMYHELIPSLQNINSTTNLDYFYHNATNHGLQVVRAHDLLYTYKDQHPKRWLYYLDDTHLNSLGMHIIAKAVAKFLTDHTN